MEGKNVIVILQRGWVWVGTAIPNDQNGLFWKLENAGTVRRWGTSHGLEELAAKGPLSETVIDKGETSYGFPITSVIGYMEVNMKAKGWKQWFHSQ